MIKAKLKGIKIPDKLLAYMLGVGLILFVVHNPDQPFIDQIALPNIGLLLIFLPLMLALPNVTRADLGPKAVYIPLLVIVASIIASVALNGGELSLALFGVALFGIYLFARMYGQAIFKPMAWAIVIGTIGLVVTQMVQPGFKTGGWISPSNYDMATGLLFFAAVVSVWKYQWVLTAIAVVGLFLTGADEAVFVLAAFVIFVLARRDWSKKLLLPVGVLAVMVLIYMPLGITEKLYSPTITKLQLAAYAVTMLDGEPETMTIVTESNPSGIPGKEIIVETREFTKEEVLNEATGKRFSEYWRLSPIKPFGYGYNVNDFYYGIPHNLPLIIIEQIGIVGALAWVWLVGYGLFKTKWKYAWFGLVALSVFDHFIWTQAAVWMPALLGVSTASNIKGDLIYKGG